MKETSTESEQRIVCHESGEQSALKSDSTLTQAPVTTPDEFDHSTEHDRVREFEVWAKEVRDPANERAEKVRRIISKNREAMAEYQVAKLDNNRWAIRTKMEYFTGGTGGQSSPWTAYPSRERCVEAFYQSADRFFSAAKSATRQEQARLQVLEFLNHRTNLFGVIEPPEADDS